MRTILLATAALALAASPAFAGDDVMAGSYGNTIVSTGGIAEVHTHYRADHTFDMVASTSLFSKTFQGTWSIDVKGELCRTFVGDAPPNTANPLCLPISPHRIGDSWTVTANGATRTVTMKAGIQ